MKQINIGRIAIATLLLGAAVFVGNETYVNQTVDVSNLTTQAVSKTSKSTSTTAESKTTICHFANMGTQEVNESALQAHLDHGDVTVSCEEWEEQQQAEEEAAAAEEAAAQKAAEEKAAADAEEKAKAEKEAAAEAQAKAEADAKAKAEAEKEQEQEVGLTPFACDSSMYLMKNSELFYVSANGDEVNLEKINDEARNSLALNAKDGFLYGISGTNLYRIGQKGSEVVGTVPVGSVYSGTFLADGTYVVNGGKNSTWYHIDISGPTITKEFPAQGNFADIARNPIDGNIYGFDNAERQLAKINPHTGEKELIGDVQTTISSAGAAFFQEDGTLFLYGANPATDTRQQDTLFTANVGTGDVTAVGVGSAVSGSDGASCVKGVDAPDPEEPTDTTGGTPTNGGGDSGEGPAWEQNKQTIGVCQKSDNPNKAGQCIQAFPVEKVGSTNESYNGFVDCMETKATDYDGCLYRWAKAEGYNVCEVDGQCGGEDTDEGPLVDDFELPEVEDGCFLMGDEYYCEHREEGACVNIDGVKYCQDKDQDCVVRRLAYERTSFPAWLGQIFTRNNSYSEFLKFCVYREPTEGEFDAQVQDAQEDTSFTPTVQVCAKRGEVFTGPHVVLPNGACITTYPHKDASRYYTTYEGCVQRGGDKQECATKWASSIGSTCEASTDCVY